jgi:hypothetical protein
VVALGFHGGTTTLEYYEFDAIDATWWDVDAKRLWKWTQSTGKLVYVDR